MKRAILGLALCLAGPVVAETTLAAQEQRLAQAVARVVQASKTADQARLAWGAEFVSHDLDGQPGLTQADLALRHQIFTARERSAMMLEWIGRDLNGDGQLTRDELLPQARRSVEGPVRVGIGLEAPSPKQVQALTDSMMAQLMSRDLSRDGVITLEEIAAALAADPRPAALAEMFVSIAFLAALDRDGDGTVPWAEYMAPLETLLARVDANRDGQLDRAERATASGRKVPRERDEATRALLDLMMPQPVCDLTPRLPGTQVLFLGGLRGTAVSNILIDSKQKVTTVIDLDIAAGDAPLSLITSFQRPVILRLTGAADRIAEVHSLGDFVGLYGRAGGTIRVWSKARGKDCTFRVTEKTAPADLREMLRVRTSDTSPLIAVSDRMETVRLRPGFVEVKAGLPGALAPDLGPAARAVWDDFLRINPGGLILLDPALLETNFRAFSLADPWPQLAGLAALVEEGALIPLADRCIQDIRQADPYGVLTVGDDTLRPTGDDEALLSGGLLYTQEEPGTWVGRAPLSFRVTREVTLPTGLNGASMVEFLLPDGVPMPQGDPGDARIRPEAKGD